MVLTKNDVLFIQETERQYFLKIFYATILTKALGHVWCWG